MDDEQHNYYLYSYHRSIVTVVGGREVTSIGSLAPTEPIAHLSKRSTRTLSLLSVD